MKKKWIFNQNPNKALYSGKTSKHHLSKLFCNTVWIIEFKVKMIVKTTFNITTLPLLVLSFKMIVKTTFNITT